MASVCAIYFLACSHPADLRDVQQHDTPLDFLQLALKHKVLLHSDACLGGFVLPFARQLGYQIPAFDFSVPGVTSMSVDTHKFGMAHKGTSVVLYRNADIRRHQYTRITEWSGGLYISPGKSHSCASALEVRRKLQADTPVH